jgi:hypothetical protein
MFTPAQTTVTGDLIRMIGQTPGEAVSAHVFSSSSSRWESTQTYQTCEQVSIDATASHMNRMTIYTMCSRLYADYFLEWSDGAGLAQMHMCRAHKDEFLEDALMSDEIQGVYVVELVYNNDPRNVVGFL